MKHYLIIETTITDPSWIEEYTRTVTPMVAAHGGRYLTRSSSVEVIEGSDPAPQFSLVAEFPSKEAFMALYESEDYQPFKEARQRGSICRMLLVPAEGV